MKSKQVLVVLSALVMIVGFAIAAKFYQREESGKVDTSLTERMEYLVRPHSASMGAESAEVTLVEFLDPECESCKDFYPQVKQLLKDYEGKIKLVVRYATFHGNSAYAIKVLEAARKQGKYWETLELLFHYQPYWGSHHDPKPEAMWDYLPQLGLDIEKLKSEMSDPATEQIIQADHDDGQKLGVQATPTFFVNGKPLQVFGISYLKSMIEDELNN